jgi:hypothetical protein
MSLFTLFDYWKAKSEYSAQKVLGNSNLIENQDLGLRILGYELANGIVPTVFETKKKEKKEDIKVKGLYDKVKETSESDSDMKEVENLLFQEFERKKERIWRKESGGTKKWWKL